MSIEQQQPAPNPADRQAPSKVNFSLSYWRSKLSYQGFILGVVCAVVSMIIIGVDQLTKKDILERRLEDRLNNLSQVLPTDLYDNNPTVDVMQISDPEFGTKPFDIYPARLKGKLSAVAFEVITIGYGGPMTLMMGVDDQGKVLGVRVIAHKETPGLSTPMEADKSDWIFVFNGQSLSNTSAKDWLVKKDGGNIDQFSGATITPRAIAKGVHQGLKFYQKHQAEIEKNITKTAGANS